MEPITSAILTIAVVAVAGLLLGNLRIRGVGLGPAGVLFAGIVAGHFGYSIDHAIAQFAKEFGLILFVFTIGLQLGPGIVQLWRQQGLLLNGMALAIVGQGALLVIAFHWLLPMPTFAAVGMFTGATTNTPSLGAAQQAAASLQSADSDAVSMLSASYALAYPGGVLGIIASMLAIRAIFRVSVADEVRRLAEKSAAKHEEITRRSILVDNARIAHLAFASIPGVDETGIRISRLKRSGERAVHVATEQTELHPGDIVQVVGTENGLDRFEPLIGKACDADLMTSLGDVTYRRVVVTDPAVLNKPLRDLSLDKLYQATVTRIQRAGVEMTARGSSRLHYGDVVHIVGRPDSLDAVTNLLGNSTKSLKETRFSPLFIGIALGTLAGIIPLQLPGVPFPVKLGLAGGPLIAAIILGLVGSVGKFVWYVPYSANLAMRELGIILFLACAGLSAGETFLDVATSRQGVVWLLAGLGVTMLPLMTTAVVARLFCGLNYLTLCGVIAGSMTDPPALAFANGLSADSDACSAAYAAVYPLTMILRIIAAQALIYALS